MKTASSIRTAAVLALICAAAAVILAVVNAVTAPRIDIYEQSVLTGALEAVSGGMEIGERVEVQDNDSITYYHVLTSGGKTGGYILGLKGNGYGGQLTLAAGYDTEGRILSVELVSNSETPGVGKKAENAGYMDKFIGKGASEPVPTNKKQLSDADSAAVSGATMTFSAISKALSAGSEFVKNMGGLI